MATQLSFLGETARVDRPWKRQRQTARTIYRDQRALDVARAAVGAETREGQVLRLLAAHWNATQRTPTALELLHWARGRGEVLFDVNSIRPRITKLVELGLVEESPTKRHCAVSGKTVHTWRVREVGA
jgi:hypothetical protein